jgi:hypothetical protein
MLVKFSLQFNFLDRRWNFSISPYGYLRVAMHIILLFYNA